MSIPGTSKSVSERVSRSTLQKKNTKIPWDHRGYVHLDKLTDEERDALFDIEEDEEELVFEDDDDDWVPPANADNNEDSDIEDVLQTPLEIEIEEDELSCDEDEIEPDETNIEYYTARDV